VSGTGGAAGFDRSAGFRVRGFIPAFSQQPRVALGGVVGFPWRCVSNPLSNEVIQAAGGLVWRSSPCGRELILIHRTRYGPEWALPKGKLDPGEGWLQAAVREVEEETGCRAQVEAFAGGSVYAVNGMPKVVLYWHMELQEQGPVQDTREVADLRWVSAQEALSLLTHANERALLAPLENRERPGR
jgi:8-oxo-dGTP pyrophosphatase MutT (NUDIX family)